MDINNLVKSAYGNAMNKGFWDDIDTPEEVMKVIPEKLCLIHSEVSEALECYRDGDMDWGYGGEKPIGFPSELADIVIRVADLCGALGINLAEQIDLKMTYNATREHKHGGKVC